MTKTQWNVLEQQQQLLKRHFLAMAMFGVKHGNQETGEFTNYNPVDVPLAALASHGGRFAFEFKDTEVGDKFVRLYLSGQKDRPIEAEGSTRETGFGIVLEGSGSRALKQEDQKKSDAHAGLFGRRSTHPHGYNNGRWQEGKSFLGEKTGVSWGMNMAFGGLGNKTGDNTFVGPEGAVLDSADQPIKGGPQQHGHAYFKYDSHTVNRSVPRKAGGRLMVGFEGSAPGLDSLVGAHGAQSAVSGNKRSLTGQSKAKDLDLPTAEMGGVKTDVSIASLMGFETLFQKMDIIKNKDPQTEKKFMKALLTSNNSDERDKIIRDIYAY